MTYLCVARRPTYHALNCQAVPGKSPHAHQPPHDREGPKIGEQRGPRRRQSRAAEVVGGSRIATRSRADADRDGESEGKILSAA